MVGQIGAYNQIQKIPNTQVTVNVVGAAASTVTRTFYTCPTGKRALFNPLTWNGQIVTPGSDQIILQIRLASAVTITIDIMNNSSLNLQARTINNIVLNAGDSLQVSMTAQAGAGNANLTSAPLELSA